MVQAYGTGPIRIRIDAAPVRSRVEPRRDKAADDARIEAILAALDAGDLEGAAALSERALRSGLEHPAPLSVMAMALECAGRSGEAIPPLWRALELEPANVSTMLALVRCLTAQ